MEGDVMNRLSEAEFKIMDIVWSFNEDFVTTNMILGKLKPQKKWTRATVSTLLNRLVQKGHLSTTKTGKERSFSIQTQKKDYLEYETNHFMSNYHNHSLVNLASCLNDINIDELTDLEEWIKEQKKKLNE